MQFALRVLIAFVIFGMSARGQNDNTKHAVVHEPARFYNGEQFHDMDEAGRMIYVSGLMDGFYGSSLFGAQSRMVNSLTDCVKVMDSKQLTAIASKYVNDNPSEWHYPMSVLMYNALVTGACKGSI